MIITLDIPVQITKFRIRSTVITRASVFRIFRYLNYANVVAIHEVNYRGLNIYPTNPIRSDGRLEIPMIITRTYGLYEIAPAVIHVDVVIEIRDESQEMTAFTSYLTGLLGSHGPDREYKILQWFPIDFPYKDFNDKRAILLGKYRDVLETEFFAIFCWLPEREMKREGFRPEIGLTERVKDEILPERDYDLIRAVITDIKSGRIIYDRVIDARLMLQYACGWDAVSLRGYPECRHAYIFLDYDNTYLDYVKGDVKRLIDKYKLPVKAVYYYLSSSNWLYGAHYHVIIELSDKVDEKVIASVHDDSGEDDKHKAFHNLHGFSVLRISERGWKHAPELLEVVK